MRFGFDKKFCENDSEFPTAFIIDETMIQIGNNVAWLWIAIEPINRTVLGAYISRDITLLIAEAFLKTLVKVYGKHPVYSDGGTWYPSTSI
jgi:putative transposase